MKSFVCFPIVARRALLLLGLSLGLAACNKTQATAESTALGSASPAGAKHPVTLLNVSYDPTRELYTDFNAHFSKKWEAEHQQKVTINQSHGGGGKQARAVIDGLEERAVNTQSMLVACAVTVVLSLALGLGGLGVLGLAVAGAIGFVTLGALSVRYVWRTLGLGAGHLAAGLAVGANLLAGLLAIGARQWLRDELQGLPLLAAGLGWSVALLAGYLAALRRARVRWVLEIEQRLRTLGLGR